MTDETIVFGRAGSPPSARGYSWGNAARPSETRIRFERPELNRILNLYGRMVIAGEWRDYAIDMLDDTAVFSVFRRASEMPLYTIEKRPRLKDRQGQYSVVAAGGAILKRGHDLSLVLSVLEKKLMKAVRAE